MDGWMVSWSRSSLQSSKMFKKTIKSYLSGKKRRCLNHVDVNLDSVLSLLSRSRFLRTWLPRYVDDITRTGIFFFSSPCPLFCERLPTSKAPVAGVWCIVVGTSATFGRKAEREERRSGVGECSGEKSKSERANSSTVTIWGKPARRRGRAGM